MFLFHCKIFCGERLFSHISLYFTVHSQRLEDECGGEEREGVLYQAKGRNCSLEMDMKVECMVQTHSTKSTD